MKKLYLLLSISLFSLKLLAQDLVYTVDGKAIPGKVTDITTDKVKYNSHEYDLDQVLFAVNSQGKYLILNGKKPNDQDKIDFLTSLKFELHHDLVIDASGEIMETEIVSEAPEELIFKTKEGVQASLKTSEIAALIRKNGTHKVYAVGKAIAPLDLARPKFIALFEIYKKPKPQVAQASPKLNLDNPDALKSSDLNVDMASFSKKALQKTEEFSTYLQSISAVNTTRDKAMKSIDMACDLFLNEEARVEVSSTNTTIKNKYKIRDYLNRLQFRSGQYDKIIIEYADINYASEFKKGTDGNYYGVVTFVQKFRGFIDGNVIYGDITKRNLTIVLKQYEKAVDGGAESGWDVFLADLGVVETKKL